jgi:predicted nucleotidyltransferase component of viral defense system
MITAREIAAWRTVAPWATDTMVEQDYLLCRAVEAIFEDTFLSTQVAMRGGTVLHKSKILRSTYTYDPYTQDATLAHLKIEVNLNENRSLYPAVSVPILVPNENAEPRTVLVQSYDLDEMLDTKLRALLQREHGRDLFDLWWAWECSKHHSNVKVDPARVGCAFRYYMAQEGSRFSSTEFRKELDRRMRSTKFLKDMEG